MDERTVEIMNHDRAIDLLDRKINEVVDRGDISPTELECLYKASKTIYYLTTTDAMNDYSYDDISRRPNWNMRGSWSGDDYSNRRGGKSYHSVNDRIIASLEREMDMASSDYERKKIEDEIHRLREMK